VRGEQQQIDTQAYMAQMVSSYTTDEQRRNHQTTAGSVPAPTLKVQGGSDIEFF
jgi:hypothetical protein